MVEAVNRFNYSLIVTKWKGNFAHTKEIRIPGLPIRAEYLFNLTAKNLLAGESVKLYDNRTGAILKSASVGMHTGE